jgi:hypothetical protein
MITNAAVTWFDLVNIKDRVDIVRIVAGTNIATKRARWGSKKN